MATTASEIVPEPTLSDELLDPYPVLVPYSTYHDVERPFGFTVPPSAAEVGPIAVAEPVVTVGTPCVVKARSAPATVPASLVAARRK